MPAPRKCPSELRERAQRLDAEARAEETSMPLSRPVLHICGEPIACEESILAVPGEPRCAQET
jgi:hypothetical protein